MELDEERYQIAHEDMTYPRLMALMYNTVNILADGTDTLVQVPKPLTRVPDSQAIHHGVAIFRLYDEPAPREAPVADPSSEPSGEASGEGSDSSSADKPVRKRSRVVRGAKPPKAPRGAKPPKAPKGASQSTSARTRSKSGSSAMTPMAMDKMEKTDSDDFFTASIDAKTGQAKRRTKPVKRTRAEKTGEPTSKGEVRRHRLDQLGQGAEQIFYSFYARLITSIIARYHTAEARLNELLRHAYVEILYNINLWRIQTSDELERLDFAPDLFPSTPSLSSSAPSSEDSEDSSSATFTPIPTSVRQEEESHSYRSSQREESSDSVVYRALASMDLDIDGEPKLIGAREEIRGLAAADALAPIQPSEVGGADPKEIRNVYYKRWIKHIKDKDAKSSPLDEVITFNRRIMSYITNLKRLLRLRFVVDLDAHGERLHDPTSLGLNGLVGVPESAIVERLLQAARQRSTRVPYVERALRVNRVHWLRDMYLALHRLESFVGMKRAKQTIAEYVVGQIYAPLLDANDFSNFAFFGNPGTGKTEVSLVLADVLYYEGISLRHTGGPLAVTSRNDFVAPYEGQTTGLTNNRFLNSAVGGVMVIDEAYALVNSERDDSGKEALTEIVKLLSQFKGMSSVVLTGYEGEIRRNLYATNPGMERRFPFAVHFEDYTADELIEIANRIFISGAGRELILSQSLSVYFGSIIHRIKEPANRALDPFRNTNAGGIRNIIIALTRRVITRELPNSVARPPRRLSPQQQQEGAGRIYRITRADIVATVTQFLEAHMSQEDRETTYFDRIFSV